MNLGHALTFNMNLEGLKKSSNVIHFTSGFVLEYSGVCVVGVH